MPAAARRLNTTVANESGIEILDNAGKTLCIMPEGPAMRQKLRHRAVLVCLRNAQGHIFLYKKTAASPADLQGDIWLPAVYGRVLAGEARYDTGERLLEQMFGISGVDLFKAATFRQPAAENADTTLFLTARTSSMPRVNEREASDGMFVDREEFRAIMRDFPHMATPLWSLVLPYIFPS